MLQAQKIYQTAVDKYEIREAERKLEVDKVAQLQRNLLLARKCVTSKWDGSARRVLSALYEIYSGK